MEGFLQGVWQLGSWMFKQLAGKGKEGVTAATKKQLDELREHWQQVELHAMQEATQIIAVSEADKILDTALRILGFPGATMADRLRAAEHKFAGDLYQAIWQAHKLRNTLAHEIGAKADREQVQRSVSTFRTALYSLGVFE